MEIPEQETLRQDGFCLDEINIANVRIQTNKVATTRRRTAVLESESREQRERDQRRQAELLEKNRHRRKQD